MWRRLTFAFAFYLLYLYATTWPPGTHLAASLAIAWILGVPLACVAFVRAGRERRAIEHVTGS